MKKKYSKKDLINELSKHGKVTNHIIERLKNLPDEIESNDKKFKLNIIASLNSNNEFELNYFSLDDMEFLFNYKVFNYIEPCLSYIEKNIQNVNKN